jgi:carbon-monoxide dehydrogenase large subunit
MAQVCADELGVDVREVTILQGDSDVSPYGFGTWGTRSTVALASMVRATRSLVRKGTEIAAFMLGVKAQDVSYDGGVFSAGPGNTLTLAEVAERAYQGYPLPEGVEPGFEETSNYDPPGLTYAYAASVATVELDVETGQVLLHDLYVVHDCGRVINPAVVQGQMVGAIAQGVGGTMMEEFKYDSDGQLLSSTFMDYIIPTALDMPKNLVLKETQTPSPYNEGYKGMSEGGCIGTPAAIANAVDAALRRIGAGPVLSLPLESEYIWALTKTKRGQPEVIATLGLKADRRP